VTEESTKDANTDQDVVRKLDTLINEFYLHIKANVAKHAKLGDLLKMIELRQKLLPDNSDRKAFWQMMEQIRRSQLPKKSFSRNNSNKPAGKRRTKP